MPGEMDTRADLDLMKHLVCASERSDELKREARRRITTALRLHHALEPLLSETSFYPPHDKRASSPAYRRTHDRLVKELNRPCLVCGVTDRTLADPKKNPFGAVQMETHHRIIEWTLANAVDPDKFNKRILPGLKFRNPTKYAAPMTKAHILDWVDHDEDNLWVLCDIHHRDKQVGIHGITYPVWGSQELVEIGLVKKEMDAVKKGKARRAGKRPEASLSR